MSEFYVTFGLQYTHAQHPTIEEAHPEGWITIEAPDERTARLWMFDHHGPQWAFMYTPETFEPHFFPRGELARFSTSESG